MKNPLLSKTLWVNLLGIGALIAQARYGFVASPEDQAVALAAVNLVLRLVTRDALDWGRIKPAGLGISLLLVTALPLLPGCSLLTAAQERPVLTELAVRAAAGRVLDEHPGWVEAAEAITADAIVFLEEGETVTLAALESFVISRVPWEELNWDEQELLQVLIRAVREETEAYLAGQGIEAPGEVRVAAARVLGWIHESASLRTLRGRAGAAWTSPAREPFGAEA